MSIGVRDLTVLGEFKPFGLVSEELEGKPLETAPEEHQYFLFHADVARERDGPAAATLSSAAVSADLDFSSPSPPSDDGDHEIFIRGSRITWSTGSRVHKRYNSPKTVIMACWCRMEAIPDALLCVLQIDTLSIYGASGEVVCIPLPFAIASIFPLPFGLLLQKAVDGNRRISISGSLLNARDLSRSGKDSGWNHHVFHQLNSFEPVVKENEAITSSHLILRHPLEEPQSGKQCLCRYLLPIRPGKNLLRSNHSAGTTDMCYELKITGIQDAVEGRINVIVNNGQIFRCSLRRNPTSSLANDCITAMAVGLQFSFHSHFATLLWGDFGSAYFFHSHPHTDSEWDAFAGAVMRICDRYGTRMQRQSPPVSGAAWDFLVNSKLHKCYLRHSIGRGAERKGRILSTGVYCEIANGSARTIEELTVLAMVGERFGRQQLDLLPLGVSLPLRHALDKCRESPPTDWPAAAYVLVGREDLAMACLGSLGKEHENQGSLNLVAISVPYMLHLQPVSVPSSLTEITGSDSMKLEDSDALHRSLEDGMEHIYNSSTQLRFGRDLRLNEVRCLLCSARPVAIETPVNPSASDQDLQQHQLWNLAQRTTALPFGRGAFTLASTYAVLTEALHVPKLVLAGRLPAQQNATTMLVSPTEAEASLHVLLIAASEAMLASLAEVEVMLVIPVEAALTYGHCLKAEVPVGPIKSVMVVIAATTINHRDPLEHDITTVGVLLGVAASYRGTMHPEVSRMLYLHVPSRHQLSFPELELPTNLQSAALVAIGLLYEGSAHPFTMKILLFDRNVVYLLPMSYRLTRTSFTPAAKTTSRILFYFLPKTGQGEIGRRSGGDNVLEREGYAVAAGYALGLEKTSVVSQTTDDHIRILGQMVDGAHINVDVTAPGATIALALIFMKTESEEMVSRLRLPVTHFDLQYVRPDFIMLRVITRNLIMWSNMQPSRNWIESQIPDVIKLGVLRLDGAVDDDEFDAEAVVQAYVNIVAGACISLGYGRIWASTNISVSLAIGFLFLGGGMQTFSTGNSAVAALLMTLYPRLPTGPSDNRCHLQAFRHLYVIAAESRRVQTVDVDTGLPVYCPLEVTIKETEHYSETSFCEVTPCILPERSVLKTVRVCGPRSGVVLAITLERLSGAPRKPIAQNNVLAKASLRQKARCLMADANFQEFCSQLLFECVSKDRPALLQTERRADIGCGDYRGPGDGQHSRQKMWAATNADVARSGVVAIDLDEKDVDNPAAKWVDCPLKRGLD
ncbi:Anaphase-promoting complex subunit [Musa troglodytarum]|uniref:Anaphase-promoting complex subunit n=1 Tax=Musa troglodytarum TaxID=320322 RepID=A0A9E7KSZ9_9LILI|nr:Anaphase-promoting complex subunit [Musa troglodytarum]